MKKPSAKNFNQVWCKVNKTTGHKDDRAIRRLNQFVVLWYVKPVSEERHANLAAT